MKTILCYGDSNTYGTKAEGGRFLRNERWTGVLQSLLGEGYYVIEEGLPGRTTVWDDPIEEYKNGKKHLMPCLHSHSPIDLVVIMLGTNDLKNRFSLSPLDIQWGMETLIRKIQMSQCGADGKSPEILLICPIQIGILSDLEQILIGAKEKCEKLPEFYKILAKKMNINYLNAGDIALADNTDGVHISLEGHSKLAKAVYESIMQIY